MWAGMLLLDMTFDTLSRECTYYFLPWDHFLENELLSPWGQIMQAEVLFAFSALKAVFYYYVLPTTCRKDLLGKKPICSGCKLRQYGNADAANLSDLGWKYWIWKSYFDPWRLCTFSFSGKLSQSRRICDKMINQWTVWSTRVCVRIKLRRKFPQ